MGRYGSSDPRSHQEAHRHFGPQRATQIRCTIDALGPDYHKLKFKSAWCMHPQAKEIEIISHGYINPPNPLKRAQRTAERSALATLSEVRTAHSFSQTSNLPRFFNSRVSDEGSWRSKFQQKVMK